MTKTTFSPTKLKPGTDICIDTTFGMLKGCDMVAKIVENPSVNAVLDGVPPKRQILVRPKGSRKSVVVDAMYVRGRL